MRTNPPEFMEHKWQSYWRTDEEGHADCGIFYEKHPGHAYALLRAPKYFSKKEWEAVSAYVIKAHESHEALVEALTELQEATVYMSRPDVSLDYSYSRMVAACGLAVNALALAKGGAA